MAAKVKTGELGYTKAREIVKVADPSTENDWLAVAEQQSRRELEATVRHAKKLAAQKRKANPGQGELMPRNIPAAPPAAGPVRVGFDLTHFQYARFESLMAKIGHKGDKANLLLDMMETYLAADESAPRGASAPQYQIHVHECPTCAKDAVQTPRGEMILAKAEVEAAHCDAIIHKPGQRNTSTIPPRVRHEILVRDRHRCLRKGCNHNRFLDIHHLVPRSKGGGNDPSNLVTLCTSCHHLWHEKGGDLTSMLSSPCDRLTGNEFQIPQPARDPLCSKPPANT